MKIPSVPKNESKRIKTLLDFQILDTISEKDFDDITHLAATICNTPISLVSLIDNERQWFKSKKGLTISETSRDVSFCAHAINQPNELFIVNDSRLDDRFYDNPLVTGAPHVVFYAGATLITPDGEALGTLCVIDDQPRELNSAQMEALRILSRQVIAQMILRKQNIELNEKQSVLELKNEELQRFAQVIAHDLKSPIQNISRIIDTIINTNANDNSSNSKQLSEIQRSCVKIEEFIQGLLNYTRAESHKLDIDQIDLNELMHECILLASPPPDINISVNGKVDLFASDEILIKQVILNLLTNTIKYNNKEEGAIQISFR
jgi:hypothetical protein